MARKKPPHFRTSKSCGTCLNWEWGYEGEGNCKKYRQEYGGESTMLCDDYQPPQPKKEPAK